MRKDQLTVKEALKFARHDFLNDLQIVLMHIDLENVSQAKAAIMKATEVMKHHSMLDRLGLPETEKWITTFDWVYTDFQKKLVCNIKPGVREADDQALVTCLTRIFEDVEDVFDPMSEYEVCFEVEATDDEWELKITIEGSLPETKSGSIQNEKIFVEETTSHNLWTFTIRGR